MNHMILRKNVLPRALSDLFPTLFLICIVPIIYWFEIWVVLPDLYPPDTSPVGYIFLFALGHYLLINVLGNYIGILISDTSVRGREMPSIGSSDAAGYCDECSTVTPHRSYHCPTCKVCILRRDHHCVFSSCCIGQFNYRYFLMFLLHMFLATAICLPFNIQFLWDDFSLVNSLGFLKIIFPMIMLFDGAGFDRMQCYFTLFFITVLGMLLVGAWFYFHFNLAQKGKVVHEMRRGINLYDLGLKENLKQALGNRWHLVWVLPFISSPLPCDGVHYETKTHAN